MFDLLIMRRDLSLKYETQKPFHNIHKDVDIIIYSQLLGLSKTRDSISVSSAETIRQKWKDRTRKLESQAINPASNSQLAQAKAGCSQWPCLAIGEYDSVGWRNLLRNVMNTLLFHHLSRCENIPTLQNIFLQQNNNKANISRSPSL